MLETLPQTLPHASTLQYKFKVNEQWVTDVADQHCSTAQVIWRKLPNVTALGPEA
jgi:hypothetical protein